MSCAKYKKRASQIYQTHKSRFARLIKLIRFELTDAKQKKKKKDREIHTFDFWSTRHIFCESRRKFVFAFLITHRLVRVRWSTLVERYWGCKCTVPSRTVLLLAPGGNSSCCHPFPWPRKRHLWWSRSWLSENREIERFLRRNGYLSGRTRNRGEEGGWCKTSKRYIRLTNDRIQFLLGALPSWILTMKTTGAKISPS